MNDSKRVRRIDQVLAEASRMLSASDTPRLDAELLLSHILDKPRTYFFTWPEAELSDEQLSSFNVLLKKRRNGTPVAYLTGYREFWSLQLKVTDATLIPRPDTELLVELALAQQLPIRQANIADLGTGTGAIALALAKEQTDWQVTAVDKSPEALAVAKENAISNDVQNVQFNEGDWCSTLAADSLDMIVSNPPYIRSDDPHLQQGDARFEPMSALASGEDGLTDIRTIARDAFNTLKYEGMLLIEHGYDQGEAVRSILLEAGYSAVRTEQDLAGHERVTLAQKLMH
ncbi:peptide chain release factor N(5)-glutamine methyltransferase [Endozoicomonas ascidiicola]|uniref:peptide chain release factor N(5)-glutamine methyltransferase n=1 Tax=Endozoicomonas ascidiicola TaxID=1698521 RepID=UPI000B142057|nr:peptide chain release factor N(5)-glutamine methyltransferase [Endozoicomonas ascidiicola]